MKKHCVNHKNKDVVDLANSLGIHPAIAASKIAIWQDKNGLDKFPTVDELSQTKEVNYQKNQTVSNEGLIASEKTIRDLAARMSDRIGMPVKFESDRSKDYKGKIENGVAYINLAYATLDTPIHEILGHPIIRAIKNKQSKFDVILPIGTSGSGKSTFIKSLPQENLVIIEPDAMRVEFTGDMNDKSKDKEIYIEAANRAIQAVKQGKQVVFDTTNLTKDKRTPFIEAIKKALPNANIQYKLMELNPELAKQRIKADIAAGKNRANVPDSTIDRHAESYKQMLEDIKSENISNYDLNQSTEIKPKIDSSKKIENLKRGDIINFQQQEFLVERVKNEGIDVRDVNTGDVDFISTEDYINETQEQPIVEENNQEITKEDTDKLPPCTGQ